VGSVRAKRPYGASIDIEPAPAHCTYVRISGNRAPAPSVADPSATIAVSPERGAHRSASHPASLGRPARTTRAGERHSDARFNARSGRAARALSSRFAPDEIRRRGLHGTFRTAERDVRTTLRPRPRGHEKRSAFALAAESARLHPEGDDQAPEHAVVPDRPGGRLSALSPAWPRASSADWPGSSAKPRSECLPAWSVPAAARAAHNPSERVNSAAERCHARAGGSSRCVRAPTALPPTDYRRDSLGPESHADAISARTIASSAPRTAPCTAAGSNAIATVSSTRQFVRSSQAACSQDGGPGTGAPRLRRPGPPLGFIPTIRIDTPAPHRDCTDVRSCRRDSRTERQAVSQRRGRRDGRVGRARGARHKGNALGRRSPTQPTKQPRRCRGRPGVLAPSPDRCPSRPAGRRDDAAGVTLRPPQDTREHSPG
jgi:hypothetical protein